jgi:hypothetical protein
MAHVEILVVQTYPYPTPIDFLYQIYALLSQISLAHRKAIFYF